MSSEGGSVSGWINQLQAGDAAAAQRLWERYFRRLVGLARSRLRGAGVRAADEEDVALSAFASFCRGAERGRFPQLTDRDDLWRLLVVLTARKAWHRRRDEQRPKRGGRLADAPGAELELDEIVGREPTPAFAAEVAEEFERRLGLLDTAELRSIAMRKMEGHTTEEIADHLGCAVSTVERRLRLIRLLWAEGEAL
jgi:DNA-directed RNA polymerase specialized sigma24 family protein